jgi:hypothetical protein
MGWSLQAITGSNTGVQAAVDIAAAAAGTLNFFGAATVSQVTVSPTAAWPAGVNQVTIGNIAGGTVNVDIPGGTENAVSITFNPPTGASGTPFISVPAMVGGPAYSIAAQGAALGPYGINSIAAAQIMDGGQILGIASALEGLADTKHAFDDGIYVGTSIALNVLSGSLSGVIYVSDDWHGGDN